MAELSDVLVMLGEVNAGVKQLRRDFSEEKEAARKSREVIHSRLDEHVSLIGRLRTDIEITEKTVAQVSEEVRALEETVDSNRQSVAPTIEDWRRMKTIGQGIAWIIAVGGLSVGAMVVWMGESLAAVVRHWLKL